MPWALIAEVVMEIIKLILERRKGERHSLLERLHDAQKCAVEGGDCSGLVALRDELKGHAA
jgi:hypothetical protein